MTRYVVSNFKQSGLFNRVTISWQKSTVDALSHFVKFLFVKVYSKLLFVIY